MTLKKCSSHALARERGFCVKEKVDECLANDIIT